jgi:hypothetical protein
METLDVSDIEDQMLQVFTTTLHCAADAETQGRKLADDIAFFNDTMGPCHKHVWDVFLHVASCVPPGHPWQDSLLRCLAIMQEGNDPDGEVRCATLHPRFPNSC